MTEEAVYRLQIQSSSSQVFFSHLPIDVDLQLTNPLDAKPPEPLAPPPAATNDNANPPAPETNKRPLETEEPKAPADQPEGPKETAAVEPEQKKMKIEEGKSEEK